MKTAGIAEWLRDPREPPLLPTTVGGVLRDAARDAPDDLALVAGVADPDLRRRWTFRELFDDAARAGAFLAGLVRPGDRVAIWAANEPEWVITMFGAALAGAVVVPVNPSLTSHEAARVLGSSGAALLVHAGEHRGNPIARHVAELREQLPELREVVPIGRIPALIAEHQPVVGAVVAPDDLAQVQFTSGTTGVPKGVCLHHLGITNNSRLMLERLGLRRGDVYVNPNPLFHLGGCGFGTIGPVQFRAAQVLVHQFEPGLFLDLLESTGATVTGAVPTMLLGLLEHPQLRARDLGALRAVSSGGAVVPPELVRRIEQELGVVYSTMFGQTEASPGVTQTHPDDDADDKGLSVGRPLPHTDVRIAALGSSTPVRPNETGELLARSPMVMRGYWGLADETDAALDAEGWLHTGDLATMDERGYCRIVGRAKDMIIRGGENISPREIEDVLASEPAIAEAAVVGVPHPVYGEEVAAFVRPREGATVDVAELRAAVSAALARHKVPAHWAVVDRFPLTASGKVRKDVLRDEWLAGRA